MNIFNEKDILGKEKSCSIYDVISFLHANNIKHTVERRTKDSLSIVIMRSSRIDEICFKEEGAIHVQSYEATEKEMSLGNLLDQLSTENPNG